MSKIVKISLVDNSAAQLIQAAPAASVTELKEGAEAQHSNKLLHHKGALSEEQLASFFSEGYIIIKQLFTPEEVEIIKGHLECVYEGAKRIVEDEIARTKEEGRVLEKQFRCEYKGEGGKSASILAVQYSDESVSIKLISWVGGVKPALVTLGRDEKITIPVAQILNSNMADHLINQGHYKKPGDQTAFAWHQDIQNRRAFDSSWKDLNGAGSFVQVLISVDESTESNGPMVIVPNSHRKDLFLDKKPKEEHESIIREEYDIDSVSISLLLKPGDTLFMHPLLLHKSDTSFSDRSREIFINGFSYPGANQQPYPGEGSAEEISLYDSAQLVTLGDIGDITPT